MRRYPSTDLRTHSAAVVDVVDGQARVWSTHELLGVREPLGRIGSPRRKVFLVHGEYDRGMHVLQEVLEQRGVACQLPGLHEPIKID